MILGPERFFLPTQGRDRVEIQLNWSKGVVDKCAYVKMRINNGHAILIPKDSLIKLAFLLANEEEQESLIPTETVKIHQLRKTFTLRAAKDMKAGEEFVFTGSFDVPVTAETLEVLKATNYTA